MATINRHGVPNGHRHLDGYYITKETKSQAVSYYTCDYNILDRIYSYIRMAQPSEIDRTVAPIHAPRPAQLLLLVRASGILPGR